MTAKAPNIREELEKAQRRIEDLEKRADSGGLDWDLEKVRENRLTEERENTDLKQALSSPFVRRVLWRIDKICGTLSSSADRDPIVTAHHEGRRSVGLDIRAAVQRADPYAYHQMEREAISDEKSRKENEDAP